MPHISRIRMILFFAALVVVGCSNRIGSPLAPDTESEVMTRPDREPSSHTQLWGYFDVYIDIPGQTATATLNRQAMFTANVVNFINSNPAGLGFHINSSPIGPDYVDVDIDVTITHPFPGLPQYNGYDVRGVFMGDGSASFNYNPDLIYPVLGTDQFMPADPMDGFGGPDGYTRWFNQPEFSTGGMSLFQYTPGKFASKGFAGTATLNPYKYFADGLGTNDDLWTWLNIHADQHGQFSSGATNTRNYYLRFPNSKGVKYGYAIIANWEAPDVHPSNAPEVVECKVIDISDVWYLNPTQNGGNLVLDVSLFNWQDQPSSIFIESTVLSSPHEFTAAEMTPIGGGENFSTYHVDIPADAISGTEDQEYWIIAECADEDYTNEFGVPNLAGTDKLAAFFRRDLTVSGEAPTIAVISPNGGEALYMALYHNITWDPGFSVANVKIEWSTDNFASDVRTIVASTPNDGSFTWLPIPNVETETARVRISDVLGTETDTSDNDFSIVRPVWLDFKNEIEISDSTVIWNTGGVHPAYQKAYDESLPALSQDHDGMAHIVWHSQRQSDGYSQETTIRSMNGIDWNGEGGYIWGGYGVPITDCMKLAAASNNTTFSAIWGYGITYYSSDVDHIPNGHSYWCGPYGTYNRIYRAMEIMADSEYLYLVSDGDWQYGDGPGIYSYRYKTPNYIWPGWPGATEPQPTRNILTNSGEMSHVRSWAIQNDQLVLAYFTNAGEGKLLRQINYASDSWDDTEVIFNGAGYTGPSDPAAAVDGDGRLFVVWVGQNATTNQFEILASMKPTPAGSWTTPIVAASSPTSFNDTQVTTSAEKVLLPTGDSKYMVLVGYENGGALQSKICPLDLWQFLPAQPVNTGTAPIKQPDVFCMTTPYSYDALFTWAFEVTPGDPGLGNRDIMFRNADFKAP